MRGVSARPLGPLWAGGTGHLAGRGGCPLAAANATVKGPDIVPLADQPPVNVVRFAFQAMVGTGTLLALVGLVYLYIRLRRR